MAEAAFVILSFFAAYGARQMYFDMIAKGWIMDSRDWRP